MDMLAESRSTEEGCSTDAARFLRALFDEHDTVLFRPIETWTENGKKQSRVDYHNTLYRVATESLLSYTIDQLLQSSLEQRTNIFFGVCPRVGPKGRFDLAWQIRTVRVLWTDIDHISVEDALKRVQTAGLPSPSIVVSTGGGVHLYWVLGEPYLIDDAGDPPSVETEWLMALAIYFDQLIREGRVNNYAEIARLGGVTRAHVTHMMMLLHLAPEIQELLLCNPSLPVAEGALRALARRVQWTAQLESLSAAGA